MLPTFLHIFPPSILQLNSNSFFSILHLIVNDLFEESKNNLDSRLSLDINIIIFLKQKIYQIKSEYSMQNNTNGQVVSVPKKTTGEVISGVKKSN